MLDTLDLAVIVALALAAAYYFGKDSFFKSDLAVSAGFVAGGAEHDRDLLATIQRNNKNAIVFFGSQTGTAEDYAAKLSKELHSKFGLNVLNADLADFDYDNLLELPPDCLVFFVVATYGEGEPTDNAVEFFNWLDTDADQMANLKYTIFSLGNSTYEFFNAVGIKLNEKLESLGAERFAEYGQGDDGVGTMDEDFLAWKELCFDALKKNLNLEERELVYEPSFKLEDDPTLSPEDEGVSNGEPNRKYVENTTDLTRGPFDHTHPYLAPIDKTKELFASGERSCVHVEFDTSGSNIKYSTGDHLAVWPSNPDEKVAKFVECFALEDKLDVVFRLKSLDSTVSVPFPTPITYGAVIRHHLEISGPISRQTLLSISSFAPTEEVKAKCIALGSDRAQFANEIHARCYNLADALLVLSEGRAWKDVPFVFLIELISSLQPRYYSISSSSSTEKSKIHITAVVETEKLNDVMVTGVTTNLLKHIEVEQQGEKDNLSCHYDLQGPSKKFSNYKLPIHVRRSTFKLPSNPSTPIILVGPGTGIAPMRGFIREKVNMAKNAEGVNLGKILLFYGCRNKDDYLYNDEWPVYAQTLGDKFEMEVAFSRVDPDKKVYVQDKITSRAKEVNELLEAGAFIYVCGDASRMARDVQATFAKIISQERGVSLEKATDLVKSLKVQNRYQEDVW